MATRTEYAHGTFNWIDFSAHDMDAAAVFYGDLFGWKMTVADSHGGPPYAMFDLGGELVAGIGQLTDEMKARMPPMWNSYVSVDDIDAIAAKVEAAGGGTVFPKQEVSESGALAFFRDPAGAVFAVWQPKKHIGAARVNEAGCLCWNELMSSDVEASKAFYGAVFDWTMNTDDGTPAYTTIENAGAGNGGMIGIDPQWGPVPPHWGVYFSVDDIDASLARVTELGGEIVVPVMDAGEVGRFAKVKDPQGGMFSLIQLRTDS